MANRLESSILLLSALLALTTPVAEAQAGGETAPEAETAGPPGWAYMAGSLGYLEGDVDPSRLTGNNAGFAVGFAVGSRFARHFSVDVETLFAGRVYDSRVQYAFADDETTLTSWMFLADARAIAPIWKLEAFVGVGVGFGISEAEIASTLVPGVSAALEDDLGFATQWMAGVDFVYSRRTRLGIEYRDLDLSADFSELSGGSIDIGGEVWMFTVKAPF